MPFSIYWGKKINYIEILKDQTKKILGSAFNISLFLFGILALVLLVFFIWRGGGIPKLFLKIFWFSALTDMFLYYTLVRNLEEQERVPRKKFELAKQASVKDIKKDASRAYSQQSIRVIEKAWEDAYTLKHKELDTLHLFRRMLELSEIKIILTRLGIPWGILERKIDNILNRFEKQSDSSLPMSLHLTQTLIRAYNEVYEKGGGRQIEVSDLFLAIGSEEGLAKEIFYDLGVEQEKLQNMVTWLEIEKKLRERYSKFRARAAWRPKHQINRAMTAIATPIINQFGQDLTDLSARGYLPLSLGHQKALGETLRILEGRESVVLVGQPGIDKTGIINQIAEKMVSEDVPKVLEDKRLISLSVAALVGGTKNVSEAQGRFLQAIREAQRSGNIVFFIRDIQNLVGGDVGLDLAEVIAPYLASNKLLLISTSNPKDYQKYIEHKALGEVLNKVDVEEPEPKEAVLMLEARAPYIEGEHQVYFTYPALERAVEFSKRYIHESLLPTKAIRVLEEAAISVKKTRGKNQIVLPEDIAKVIAEKTGVPVTSLQQEESEKLLRLEEEIHKRVIGQDEAVRAVAAAMRRARAELRSPNRPIANFLFLGPTGVGKTQLAKTLAAVYFGSENSMLRFDMSEFQELGSIDRFIGTLDTPGILTSAVKDRAFSLVLLDEIEKAHRDILNLFLQVMDDGRLTSGQGEVIDFTNVILIATSNAATLLVQDRIRAGDSIDQIKTALMENELRKYFTPEFLNRFDDIIVFKPLTQDEIQEIAKLLLGEVASQLLTRGINLKVTLKALEELSAAGFDPAFGARPLRRVIQERVQNVLANYLLQNKLSRRDVVVLEKGGSIRVEKAQAL